MSIAHTQFMRELRARGNDEHVVRLLSTLLDLDQEQVISRVDLLMELGTHYVTLALSREGEITGKDIEEALSRLDQGSLAIASGTSRDPLAMSCYEVALHTFSSAINQAPLTYDISAAAHYRELASALCGEANQPVPAPATGSSACCAPFVGVAAADRYGTAPITKTSVRR